MNIRAFITHKKAEFFTDCQDRFSINSDTKSIALSDGMSQSIFQKYWAEILVDTYTSKSDWCPNIESVRELSTLWINKVNEVIEDQRLRGKSTWRVERSLADGCSAGATFLGIRFEGSEWKCQVLGDSCLVRIQNNKIKEIISSHEGPSFSNYPDYYDSNPNKVGKGQLKEESGRLLPGDVILLVSDPFSDFLFRKSGTGEGIQLIERLLSINSHEQFEEVVEEWRTQGMHNDDSTLIVVEPDESDEFHVVYKDCIGQMVEEEKNVATSLIAVSISEKDHASDSAEKQPSKPAENVDSVEFTLEERDEKSLKFNYNDIFGDCFFHELENCIYSNLEGLMGVILSNKMRKEKAQTITNEIKLIITDVLKGK